MTIWVERRDTPEHVLHITDGPIAVEIRISEPALRHLWGELGRFLETLTEEQAAVAEAVTEAIEEIESEPDGAAE